MIGSDSAGAGIQPGVVGQMFCPAELSPQAQIL